MRHDRWFILPLSLACAIAVDAASASELPAHAALDLPDASPPASPDAPADAPARVVAAAGDAPRTGADDAGDLDTIRVFGAPRPRRALPGTVDTLDGDTLRDGQRRVHLSEALQRVPGLSGFDRNNYAQDLQIQSRGFGARSTFGIRGIRLIVDGIPASAADGQGQAATFPLDTLDRIDILRAPLALQYGNASGGAIVGESVLDGLPAHSLDAWAGSHGSRRLALRTDGGAREWRWRASASAFETDGVRPQSAAERRQFNAIAEWSPRAAGRLRIVVNSLRQPEAEDPLGLDRASYARDPDGTAAAASIFDTRKRTAEDQLGLDWRHDGDGTAWWAGLWRTRREVMQVLSIPVAAQRAPSSAGGVIDVARDSTGVNAGLRRDWSALALTAGIDAVRLDEARRGFENHVLQSGPGVPAAPVPGVRGRLRRDERNRVDTLDAHLLADLRLGEDWSALAGVRRSWLRFRSDDRYIAPGNGDDSGGVRRAETAVSLGVSRLWADGEAFAAWGSGYETPTLNETAYRADGGAGFNVALRPARTRSAEAGLRWRFGGAGAGALSVAQTDAGDGRDAPRGPHALSLSVYRIDGRDEIVPATSSGGRSSFVNAGRTRREGAELALSGPIGGAWRYVLAASAIDARFTERYTFIASGAQRTVPAGNRVPGIPRGDLYAELAWASPADRWRVAAEALAVGEVAVDDLNSDAAAGYARFALRAEWRGQPRAQGPRLGAFARVDNLFDRRHVGSVIVNEANARFFEPASGRTWTMGLRADW